MLKIKIIWTEGNQERNSETELPQDKNWEELIEYIRQLLKKSCKYADEKPPEGLLKDNEIL